jgi:hypothetical protein
VGDKDSRHGNDPEQQSAEEHYIPQSERDDMSFIDGGDGGADPTPFSGQNLEMSAIHACERAVAAPEFFQD